MSAGLYSHTTRGTGTVLTAAIYNADHTNHITNQNPSQTGAYSDNVAQMQLITDPGGVGSESLAPSLAGEIERLRFAMKGVTGKAQWYIPPVTSIEAFNTSVAASLALKADTSTVNAALALKETLGEIIAINSQSGTTYTLALTDKGKTVEVSNAGAITLTIPTNASVAFPVNSYVNIVQTGAGQITLTPAGGVTLRSHNGLKLAAQYAMATMYKRATDEWVVGGDVSL